MGWWTSSQYHVHSTTQIYFTFSTFLYHCNISEVWVERWHYRLSIGVLIVPSFSWWTIAVNTMSTQINLFSRRSYTIAAFQRCESRGGIIVSALVYWASPDFHFHLPLLGLHPRFTSFLLLLFTSIPSTFWTQLFLRLSVNDWVRLGIIVEPTSSTSNMVALDHCCWACLYKHA